MDGFGADVSPKTGMMSVNIRRKGGAVPEVRPDRAGLQSKSDHEGSHGCA